MRNKELVVSFCANLMSVSPYSMEDIRKEKKEKDILIWFKALRNIVIAASEVVIISSLRYFLPSIFNH